MTSYRNLRATTSKVLFAIAFLVIFVVCAGPFLWLGIASFQTQAGLLLVPPRILPENITTENYAKLLFSSNATEQTSQGTTSLAVGRGFRLFRNTILNSVIVSTLTTILCLWAGSLSAYAISRVKFVGSKALLLLVLATRMIPPLTLAIPIFLLANKLRLFDNKLMLILVYSSFTLPFIIWILKTFFDQLPPALEDAARIDGCSRMKTISKIILPLSAPGLVGAGVFSFMSCWSEFFFALILTNSDTSFTVPVSIAAFGTDTTMDYASMITAGVCAIIPPVVITLIFQKYVVKGLTAGSVKG